MRWQEKAADYDMEILYKPGKENPVRGRTITDSDQTLMPAVNSFLRIQVVKGYKNSPLDNLIKEVEKRKESTKRYTVEKDYSTIGRTNSDLGDFVFRIFSIATP